MPELHLLRHGIPDSVGVDPPLSEEGVARMEAEARGMIALGLALDAILSSPLIRARQTALIVAGALGRTDLVVVSNLLAPGCRLAGLDPVFASCRAARAILLVGHQPDMGRIASDLVGSRETLALERGALCSLQVAAWPPRPPATLERLLGPAQLIGRS